MYDRASRNEVAFVEVVFDRLVWDSGRYGRTPLDHRVNFPVAIGS
jgi:hypothetical protein